MDQIIKKKLAKNWFKTLQEVFCQEIEDLEGMVSEAPKRIMRINEVKNTTTQNEGSSYSVLLGPIENIDANKLVSSFISKGYKNTEIILK